MLMQKIRQDNNNNIPNMGCLIYCQICTSSLLREMDMEKSEWNNEKLGRMYYD